VLTNNHVIRGATTIRVSLPGAGRAYGATVLGYAIGDDVAVLRLSGASGLGTVRIGRSAAVRPGQSVTAVGNAGGRGALVTTRGAVTGVGRTITVQDGNGGAARLRGLIRTDANLRPGDSGGPLLDSAGRVIGINTAASAGFSFGSGGGVGYAIPIDRAVTIQKQILAGRSSATVHVGPTAFLGVSVTTVSPVPGGREAGVRVNRVVPGGPADRAGIAAGDVITAIGGRAVSSLASVLAQLQSRKPGDTVSLAWVDELGDRSTGSARLVEGPPQ
jgi:S1-C subfamily serine protease